MSRSLHIDVGRALGRAFEGRARSHLEAWEVGVEVEPERVGAWLLAQPHLLLF